LVLQQARYNCLKQEYPLIPSPLKRPQCPCSAKADRGSAPFLIKRQECYSKQKEAMLELDPPPL
jgi:hypothetical protein